MRRKYNTWRLKWIQCYPCRNNTAPDTMRSLKRFLPPESKTGVKITENSFQFTNTCEDLSWNHYTSTSHWSETHETAEGVVSRVKEGTSTLVVQSGLDEQWRREAMECFGYSRNMPGFISRWKLLLKEDATLHSVVQQDLFRSKEIFIINFHKRHEQASSIQLCPQVLRVGCECVDVEYLHVVSGGKVAHDFAGFPVTIIQSMPLLPSFACSQMGCQIHGGSWYGRTLCRKILYCPVISRLAMVHSQQFSTSQVRVGYLKLALTFLGTLSDR